MVMHRYDMSVSKEMYIQTDHKGRTLETLKKCSQYPPSAATDKRLGSIESPLLDIEIDHVVPDELHLLLWVTDILIRNLIFYMKKLDVKARSGNQHVNDLLTKVQEYWISFQIWGKGCWWQNDWKTRMYIPIGEMTRSVFWRYNAIFNIYIMIVILGFVVFGCKFY